MTEVMPNGFEPRRRGRKPNYNVADLLTLIDEAETAEIIGERWMKVVMDPSNAKSAKRQLERLGGFDVSLEHSGDVTNLYIRRTA